MSQDPTSDSDLHSLRTRLAEEVAAGRTIVLSKTELASPRVRAKLPQLLDGLPGPRDRGPLRVPGYTLLGEIGRGGMSSVHLAQHEALGRHVALKVAQKFGDDERAQQRLLAEARAMARVRHPHVVAIHDVLELGDNVAIAMEWVAGLTLGALLHELPERPAPDDMVLVAQRLGAPSGTRLEDSTTRFFVRTVHDIALAVQAVHDAGLLHLDIKPSNILLRTDGHALLADFGVVREMDLLATHTQTFAGTPVYASLEQLRRDDEAFGPWTDIYALGMTLYHALARVHPLLSLDLKALIETVAAGRLPSLTSRVDVAPDLATIVHKALSPEPQQRYATAAAFAADLRAFLEGRPIAGRPATLRLRLRRWARAEPWKAALAITLAVLLPTLTVVGGYLLAMLPRIEEARRVEQRARLTMLKQTPFLRCFLQNGDDENVVDELVAATEVDPTVPTVACLLLTLLDEQHARLPEMLQRYRKCIDGSAALTMLRERIEAGMSFFTDAQVDTLEKSTDPGDAYVLGLERLLRADDVRTAKAHEAAFVALTAANRSTPDDPLLLGLLVWSSAIAFRQDPGPTVPLRCEERIRGLQATWPDVPETLAWVAGAIGMLDPDRADSLLRGGIQRFPSHRLLRELHIGNLVRSGRSRLQQAARDDGKRPAADVQRQRELAATQLRQALVEAERALAAACIGGDITYWHCVARRELGEKDVQPLPGEVIDDYRSALLRAAVDPKQLAALCDSTLTKARPEAHRLRTLYDWLSNNGDRARLDAVWEKWRAVYPDRRALDDDRMRTLFRDRDMVGIGKLVPLLHMPDELLTDNGSILALGLMHVHDWANLRTTAERWLRIADTSKHQQAASYLGLACARLGDFEAALQHLSRATAVEPSGGTWFGLALVEHADMLLRTDEGAADHASMAADCMRRLDAYRNSKSTRFTPERWSCTVKAAVRLANGDKAGARALLAQAEASGVEPHAPDDLAERLAALKQRCGL